MNLFLREKQDGRRAPGYLVYLAGGLLAIAGILLLHRGAAPGAPVGARRRPGSVAAVTQAAAMMSPVKMAGTAPAPNAASFRLHPAAPAPRPAPGPMPDSFDAINAALAGAPAPPPGSAATPSAPLEDGTAGAAERASAGYARLPPAYAPPRPGAPGTAKNDRVQLLGYRDASADPPATPSEVPPAEPRPHPGPSLVPRGTLIYVYLLTTVDSSNPSAVIQFGIARAVYFNHRRRLPFGTRLLGRISGRPARDRLNLVADTVLFPDGREQPVNATAVEADEIGANVRPGVAAEYFPPPTWAEAAPYVSDLFTGFMGLLQSRAQTPFALGVGGVSVQTTASDSARAPLYQASGQAIQDYTQSRLKEVEQRYASYYLIPAGTDCWLQMENDLVLPTAVSRSNPPAPQNLPLSPGTVSHASEDSP